MTTQKKTARPASILALIHTLKARHHCGWGLWALIGTLLFLSLLAGANFEAVQRVYVAGQVAENDVIADRDILVEDSQATKARRKQVLLLQPPVYDLSLEPYTQFQGRILEILRSLNSGGEQRPVPDPSLQRLVEELTPAVADEVLPELALPEVQTYLLKKLLPQIREHMAEGLVGDIRVHAVQLALSRLGYYTGALDGDYGEKTNDAMKQFQRKNGLDPDGSAGPLSQPVLFALASGSAVPGTGGSSSGGSSSGGSSSGGSSGSGSTSNGSTAPSSGTLKTTASVNLRKSASTSSARLAVVPKGVNLSYTETYVKSGVTWFKVRYNSLTGWLMGTFVSAAGNASSPAIGTMTITMPGTRVRDAADGNKTGTVLAKGTVVDLLAQPTSAGGYTWYNIRTSSGLVGFVRGDCATASIGGGSGSGSGGSSGVGAQLGQDLCAPAV